MLETWLTPLLMGIAALLYSSVGHAGGSGFLAVMTFTGVAPAAMKPTALLLNICAATVATWRFQRAGMFSWSLFWPFAISSIPCAYLGGTLDVDAATYRVALGAFLLLSAAWLAWSRKMSEPEARRPFSIPVLVLAGAAIGLASGLIGIGGGVFLSPVILFMRWSDIRTTSGVAATFILVNSIAGLAGHYSSAGALPPHVGLWAVAAIIGASIGSWLGSRKLSPPVLRLVLAVVLVIAGLKLIAAAW